jgi:hypothetical protein
MGTHDHPLDRERLGRAIIVGVGGLFLLVTTPVLIAGAPLADDFHNCLEPQRQGLSAFLAESAQRLGAIRPARFLEIFITNGICEHLLFGFAIAIPLVLTLLVAWLLRGLLRDLDVRTPWPEIAAGLWLLQPLGTESSLWPAALHVPLGLVLALGALRLHRAGHHGWGALAAFGAALSAEQTILALPLAAWMVTPRGHQRRALAASMVPVILVLVSFVLWPGEDPRLHASLSERVASLARDPLFYIEYPAVGLGVHSIPLGIQWAFPMSILVVGVCALGGGWIGQRFLQADARTQGRSLRALLFGGLALAALANIPVVLAIPRYGSPRLFAPTWLIFSGILAILGSRTALKRWTLVGALAGAVAAGALLSLALSVQVRLRSAAFSQAASEAIARRVPQGADVAVCAVRRTVVEPAPRGAFALHEFVYDWAARDALEYYTGRKATFALAGELWQRPCPDPSAVDRVVSFTELVQEVA